MVLAGFHFLPPTPRGYPPPPTLPPTPHDFSEVGGGGLKFFFFGEKLGLYHGVVTLQNFFFSDAEKIVGQK
jgi:hypothetical protein